MVLAIQRMPSCSRAWIAAANAVMNAGDEAYDVIIDVADPTAFDERDTAVVKHVDRFLRKYNQYPISTVVNTIFPSSLYRQQGYPAVFDEYQKVYGKLTTKRWGRYFERMIRRADPDGPEGAVYNPLQKLIEKLQDQNDARTPFKSAYELPLYNPDLDRNRYRDAPCLSHLSFKRHPDLHLSLTAVYRNHSYVTRCLGNLIGLGHLQAFVAEQAGLKVGSLTCVSTHAEIDTGHDKENKTNRWGITEARELILQAWGIVNANVTRQVTA
jgi:thymidylate synthase